MNTRDYTLQELRSLYHNKDIVTDKIKKRAWQIRGCQGSYFRMIIKGFGTDNKPMSEGTISSALSALKQAIKDDFTDRKKFMKDKKIINR